MNRHKIVGATLWKWNTWRIAFKGVLFQVTENNSQHYTNLNMQANTSECTI
jgi:hypothetical protein